MLPWLDAVRGEGSSHRLGEPLGQRQAHAGALDVGVLGTQAVEGGEQPRQLVGRDARAGVVHEDADPAVGGGLAGEADAAAVAVVLDGVGGQVQQDLPEPLPVGLDDPRAARLGRGQDAELTFGGQGSDEVEGLGEQLGDVHRLRRQRQAAGLDAGDVQDLVDKPEQVTSALQDLLHALLLPGL